MPDTVQLYEDTTAGIMYTTSPYTTMPMGQSRRYPQSTVGPFDNLTATLAMPKHPEENQFLTAISYR